MSRTTGLRSENTDRKLHNEVEANEVPRAPSCFVCIPAQRCEEARTYTLRHPYNIVGFLHLGENVVDLH